jgi:hypothetical protein
MSINGARESETWLPNERRFVVSKFILFVCVCVYVRVI